MQEDKEVDLKIETEEEEILAQTQETKEEKDYQDLNQVVIKEEKAMKEMREEELALIIGDLEDQAQEVKKNHPAEAME